LDSHWQTKATLLYEDNLACIAMSENPVRLKFSRHFIRFDIKQYFVRELVLAGFLKLVHLRTHKMVADALTKSLPSRSTAFVGHRQIMTGHVSFATRPLHASESNFERLLRALHLPYFFGLIAYTMNPFSSLTLHPGLLSRV